MAIRAISYLRVSTTRQGVSGLGLEAQRETVCRYLGADPVDEFVEVESGRRSDRPQLVLALARCRALRIPLVVANVSRLTRSAAFLSTLLESGAEIRFCDLPQIEGPTGRFLLQSMASVAELEAGMISQRTRAALQAAKARGRVLGRPENLSGGDRGRQASITARAAAAERRRHDLAPMLADLQAQGVTSHRGLAKALTAAGVPAPRGGAWSGVQVARLGV
jgi:DNA invertase Pin-like site-specific DNA recombinase